MGHFLGSTAFCARSLIRRGGICSGVLAGALTIASPHVAAQQNPNSRARVPVVAVLDFALPTDSAHGDTTALEHGIPALLESELAADKRVHTVPRSGAHARASGAMTSAAAAAEARSRGASYAVLGEVAHVGDSLRVTARVIRTRDTSVFVLDDLTAALDEVPTLASDLAQSVADSIAPRTDATRGGPLFRPPRPPVPFAAMTLYSKAVRARAAGDADTAVRLLRQATVLAPHWEQPKVELVALKQRP
jgi:TolB-like protein